MNFKEILKKRVLTSLFLLTLPLSSFAVPVSVKEAEDVVKNYIKAKERFFLKKPLFAPSPFKKGERFSIIKYTPLKNAEGKNLAYIFELSPKGYIVTSTDTDIHPVIVYSFRTDFVFKDHPENILLHMLLWDLEKRKEAFSRIPQRLKDLKKKNNKSWKEMVEGEDIFLKKVSTAAQWGPWLDTKWHQGGPYNKFCPLDPVDPDTDPEGNARCVVGCAALSMAQIMDYWEYPWSVNFTSEDKYTSTIDPGDGRGERMILIDDDCTRLDFPSFSQLNGLLTQINYADNDDIAALCFACGISLKMDYSSYASGVDELSEEVYLEKFGYANAERLSGTDPQFYPTLREDMKGARPAQIAIINDITGEGHAIVADGYKNTEEYHLNFGWGGTHDGWYFLPKGMPKGYNVVDHGVLSIWALKPEVTPNPFRPLVEGLKFKYLPEGYLQIKIYNLEGEVVRSEEAPTAELPKENDYPYWEWDGRNDEGDTCASGLYFYILKVDGKIMSKGALLLVK